MEHFYNVVLLHPICLPPKGRRHMSILHDTTESSEDGPNSGSVRNAIMEPFYDVVLRHPRCPPPNGSPHKSILHGATVSAQGAGPLGMRSQSPIRTAFYTIQAFQHEKGISIRGFSIMQSPSEVGGS
ncbi:hypothetical protein B9Z19DRAFT_1124585 [Tuber borchii]|uniref:Uncharacterized protein n=1 Tax=Tuber borchii TaxID=42251 RepID=A0A2T6ZWI0_TUBBO|nr:hypothetical protein B9Z19DRAFT_1124585 [Tuber borchii]